VRDKYTEWTLLRDSKSKKVSSKEEQQVQLEVLRTRQKISQESKQERLLSEKAVESTKEVNFCDGPRKKKFVEVPGKEQFRRFEFLLTRNIRNGTMHATFVTGANRRTFYKSKVDETQVMPFWLTSEGKQWDEQFQDTIPPVSKQKMERVKGKTRRGISPSENLERISVEEETQQAHFVEIIPEQADD